MKVLIVSDAQSVHTQRWVSSLNGKGVEIVLYSIVPYDGDFYTSKGIRCHYFDLFNYKRENYGILYPILRHLQAVRDLKRVIKEEKPQILHSHFVTSYSLIAALSGFHPLIESVWGSDVYIYPKKSILHRLLVKFTLSKADKILSTSNVMAEETHKYTKKEIEITPFGVDTSLFRRAGTRSGEKFVVGSVKSLSANYGNEYILRAFAELVRRNPDADCTLELIGKGPHYGKLTLMAWALGIDDKVNFRGFIPNDSLPKEFEKFSITCYMSNSESFGVSAIESMACECPVVASDADGFREVIEDGATGIIVPRKDYMAAADAMEKLLHNRELVEKMGKAGRKRVCDLYTWDKNVDSMIQIYLCLDKESRHINGTSKG